MSPDNCITFAEGGLWSPGTNQQAFVTTGTERFLCTRHSSELIHVTDVILQTHTAGEVVIYPPFHRGTTEAERLTTCPRLHAGRQWSWGAWSAGLHTQPPQTQVSAQGHGSRLGAQAGSQSGKGLRRQVGSRKPISRGALG